MKKITFGLGTAIAIGSPIAAVVACGSTSGVSYAYKPYIHKASKDNFVFSFGDNNVKQIYVKATDKSLTYKDPDGDKISDHTTYTYTWTDEIKAKDDFVVRNEKGVAIEINVREANESNYVISSSLGNFYTQSDYYFKDHLKELIPFAVFDGILPSPLEEDSKHKIQDFMIAMSGKDEVLRAKIGMSLKPSGQNWLNGWLPSSYYFHNPSISTPKTSGFSFKIIENSAPNQDFVPGQGETYYLNKDDKTITIVAKSYDNEDLTAIDTYTYTWEDKLQDVETIDIVDANNPDDTAKAFVKKAEASHYIFRDDSGAHFWELKKDDDDETKEKLEAFVLYNAFYNIKKDDFYVNTTSRNIVQSFIDNITTGNDGLKLALKNILKNWLP